MKTSKLLTQLFLIVLLLFSETILLAQSRSNSRHGQNAEVYKPDNNNRQIKELDVLLPMRFNKQRMKVEVVDNMAIYEGDIVLGHEAQFNNEVSFAIAIANNNYRWENGIMPYTLSPEHPRRTEILQAIDHVNKKTKMCLVERTNERDYVNFLSGSGCWSYVGRQTYEQPINIGNCSLGSIIHEICHAAGLYHEQSRSDRDQFIEIKWENISEDRVQNFNKKDETGMDIGEYDFASIMHYPATAFSKNGKPTIVSKVSAKAFGQRDALSIMDINALNMLYEDAEGCGNEEVVTTNPTGGETSTTEPNTNTGSGRGSTTTPTTGTEVTTTTTTPTTTRGRGRIVTTTQPTTSTAGRGRGRSSDAPTTNINSTPAGKSTMVGKSVSSKTSISVGNPKSSSSTAKAIEGKVSFYAEANYRGKYLHLPPGRYLVAQLLEKIGAEDISSVLMSKELQVEFYLKNRTRKTLSNSLPELNDFKERYQMLVIKPKPIK